MKKIKFFICIINLFFLNICLGDLATVDTFGFFLSKYLNLSESNSTIILKHGVYKGNFVLNKKSTLTSTQNSIITSAGKKKIFFVTFPYNTIKGVYFKESGKDVTLKDSCVFIGKYANSTQLLHNKFFDCGFSVWIHSSNYNYLSNNKIIGTLNYIISTRGNSIHIFSSRGTLVENNYVIYGRDGIYISASKEVIIKKNIFNNTRYGIHYMYSNSCSLVSNKISNSSAGAAIMYSKFVDITNNYVTESKEHGILIRDVLYSFIFVNKTFKNYEGIFFGSSYYNNIIGNDMIRNFIAVKISNGSDENSIVKNNFIDNKIQVQLLDNRTFFWNGFSEGNFWTHFVGVEKEKKGIGIKPFHVTLVSDWLIAFYPNMKLIFNSPIMLLLQKIENQFPVICKSVVIDKYPLIRPTYVM